MQQPERDPLKVVTMVWKDLYGDAACQEAKTRKRDIAGEPSKFWQNLLKALCK